MRRGPGTGAGAAAAPCTGRRPAPPGSDPAGGELFPGQPRGWMKRLDQAEEQAKRFRLCSPWLSQRLLDQAGQEPGVLAARVSAGPWPCSTRHRTGSRAVAVSPRWSRERGLADDARSLPSSVRSTMGCSGVAFLGGTDGGLVADRLNQRTGSTLKMIIDQEVDPLLERLRQLLTEVAWRVHLDAEACAGSPVRALQIADNLKSPVPAIMLDDLAHHDGRGPQCLVIPLDLAHSLPVFLLAGIDLDHLAHNGHPSIQANPEAQDTTHARDWFGRFEAEAAPGPAAEQDSFHFNVHEGRIVRARPDFSRPRRDEQGNRSAITPAQGCRRKSALVPLVAGRQAPSYSGAREGPGGRRGKTDRRIIATP